MPADGHGACIGTGVGIDSATSGVGPGAAACAAGAAFAGVGAGAAGCLVSSASSFLSIKRPTVPSSRSASKPSRIFCCASAVSSGVKTELETCWTYVRCEGTFATWPFASVFLMRTPATSIRSPEIESIWPPT